MLDSDEALLYSKESVYRPCTDTYWIILLFATIHLFGMLPLTIYLVSGTHLFAANLCGIVLIWDVFILLLLFYILGQRRVRYSYIYNSAENEQTDEDHRVYCTVMYLLISSLCIQTVGLAYLYCTNDVPKFFWFACPGGLLVPMMIFIRAHTVTD